MNQIDQIVPAQAMQSPSDSAASTPAEDNTQVVATKKSLTEIKKELDILEKLVRRIKYDINSLEEKKDYKNIDGIEGTFDGTVMITESGEKIEVPANYAAKSKVLFGDRLKMVEDEGKKVFKHIHKQERKKVSGILNRKDGKWHLLTDAGSYRISDVAAEFQHAQVNLEATAYIPETTPNVPFAALDKVNIPEDQLESLMNAVPQQFGSPSSGKVVSKDPASNEGAKPSIPKTTSAPRTMSPSQSSQSVDRPVIKKPVSVVQPADKTLSASAAPIKTLTSDRVSASTVQPTSVIKSTVTKTSTPQAGQNTVTPKPAFKPRVNKVIEPATIARPPFKAPEQGSIADKPTTPAPSQSQISSLRPMDDDDLV